MWINTLLNFNSSSKISVTWILMDVLLDIPFDILERTTPSLPAFGLPIPSVVQLAGEVVWISHRWGLGMPRHRKTRLLHWPAYRLLFLIRILDWKQIVSFSNREQGVVIFFYLQDFFLTLLQLPTCWSSGAKNWSPYVLLSQTLVHDEERHRGRKIESDHHPDHFSFFFPASSNSCCFSIL